MGKRATALGPKKKSNKSHKTKKRLEIKYAMIGAKKKTK